MKINFEGYNQNPNVDKVTTSQGKSSVYQTGKAKAYALDISGTVTDNMAYGVHGRTTEDVMQSADALLPTDVQRNYMTVMSNSMSEEDYSRMMEQGFDPAAMDSAEAVTIVDHIKASMAESGQVVAGYNDDLSAEELSAVTGSEGYAREIVAALKQADAPVNQDNVDEISNTVTKAEEVTKFTDSAKKYMIENQMNPTVENIYYAAYSAGNDASRQAKGYYSQDGTGYFAQKAEALDWQQLEPQVKKALEDMEFPKETEDYLDLAKWLIETGVPVTEDAIIRLQELEAVSFPLDVETVINRAATAISEGKSGMDADMGNGHTSIYIRAVEIKEKTDALTEEAADQVVKEGKDLTLKNLFAVQKEIEQKGHNSVVTDENITSSMLSARKQLVQVQLKMTADVNIKLLKSAYSIDTTTLSTLLEDITKQEEALKKQFFGGADGSAESDEIDSRSNIYRHSVTALAELPFLPAAVIGRMLIEDGSSITYLHTAGNQLKAQYEAAGETYEALMTAPRKDMGDSIKKAFRNVDDILADLNMEPTEDNRKAVRILGYNQMNITKEALKNITLLDKQVENVIKTMTPDKTLSLIRNGINPLTEDLDQLEEKLTQMEQDPQKDTVKYSRFLYQLEQNHEISEAERGAYIGVYRLFHQLEKSDGAAIGRLASQGSKLTFRNLLTAIRSSKAGNMDVNVDNSFGMVSEVNRKSASISSQIDEGVLAARLAHGIYRDMTPEALKNAGVSEDMTIEQLSVSIQEQDNTDFFFSQDALTDIQEAATAEKEIYEYLEGSRQIVSADNLLAAEKLMQDRGSLFKQLKQYCDRIEEEDEAAGNQLWDNMCDDIKEITENFTDRNSAVKAYRHMTADSKEILETAQDTCAERSVDVKMLSSCHKQLSLAAAFLETEQYEIPVVLDGTLTSINLTLIHNSEEKGSVSVTLQTEKCGKTGVKLYQDGDNISAFFVTDKEDAMDALKKIGDSFKTLMKESGKEVTREGYHISHELNLLTFPEKPADTITTGTETSQLYQTAKQFLSAVSAVRS